MRGPIPIGMFFHAAGDAMCGGMLAATEFILKLLISGLFRKEGKEFCFEIEKVFAKLGVYNSWRCK